MTNVWKLFSSKHVQWRKFQNYMRAQSARNVVLILWIKSKKDLRSSNLIAYQTEAQANFLFFFSTTICELYLLCNQKWFNMSYLNTIYHIFLNITCVIANFFMKLYNRKVDIANFCFVWKRIRTTDIPRECVLFLAKNDLIHCHPSPAVVNGAKKKY